MPPHTVASAGTASQLQRRRWRSLLLSVLYSDCSPACCELDAHVFSSSSAASWYVRISPTCRQGETGHGVRMARTLFHTSSRYRAALASSDACSWGASAEKAANPPSSASSLAACMWSGFPDHVLLTPPYPSPYPAQLYPAGRCPHQCPHHFLGWQWSAAKGSMSPQQTPGAFRRCFAPSLLMEATGSTR